MVFVSGVIIPHFDVGVKEIEGQITQLLSISLGLL
jgi:hypothetical protein